MELGFDLPVHFSHATRTEGVEPMRQLQGNLLDLVESIRLSPGVRCEELAKRYNVSPRTIRNRINRANTLMRGNAELVNKRGLGYSLTIVRASLRTV